MLEDLIKFDINMYSNLESGYKCLGIKEPYVDLSKVFIRFTPVQ